MDLSPYKARLVANGRTRQHGIDCDETFSSVVKPVTVRTIRTVLSIVVSRSWPIHQLDVKNASLHGHLLETVYMHQPPGFMDPQIPDYACHLKHSLYGHKQAPHAWFQRFVGYATRVGFQHSKTDSSLFIFHCGSHIAYLLLYVDDIILTTSSSAFLQRVITLLHGEFAMTGVGSLNYFLGISAQRSYTGLFLSQSAYGEEILEHAHMQKCNPSRTPVDTESKLGADGDLLCLYIHDLWESHLAALKRLLRYVRGTNDHGLQLHVAEAEYRGVANVVAETAWACNLLREFHAPLFTATSVYCDNASATYMSTNPVSFQYVDQRSFQVLDFSSFAPV
uniref:Reverse transcriptase Ty1/copia-type domain-containing protein n=1 Tax=Tanacetum cinerariifolium TaxID=118510 RepID=A0A6L2JFG0_TANCI|nr:hypothetical protein [Tanacetum cinerariifolium]